MLADKGHMNPVKEENVMPAVKNIIAGLAFGTLVAGGALALGATAASAADLEENGLLPTNGTVLPIVIQPEDDDHHHVRDHRNFFDRDHNNWWHNKNWWNQNAWKDSYNDTSGFGIVAKDVAIGFQDKTNRDDHWFNNFWFNDNNWWNHNNNWWNDRHAHDHIEE